MYRSLVSGCLPLFLVFLISGVAPAQQLPPGYPAVSLTNVSPTGGNPDTTSELTVVGTDLEDANALWFSHSGIKAELIAAPPPEKGKPVPPPKFKVTIPADVPAGTYDVRVAGKWGLSNPRAFVVSNLKEVVEEEPNNDVPQATKVELNTAVTGVISANTDVDYYTFTGKKGTRVIVHCASSSIDSRLTPLLELYDSQDHRLVGNRQYRDRDAFLSVVLPADGTYVVRVCEFAYQIANAQYFYRLRISTSPWIAAAYPPVVDPGKAAKVTLFGRNLPGGQEKDGLEQLEVTVAPAANPLRLQNLELNGILGAECFGLDGFQYRIKKDKLISNPVLLSYAHAPIVLDNDDNNTLEKAQTIPVPCELCGRVERRGDRDHYRFEAKQGEVLILEGFADRIGSPLDLSLEVRRTDNGTVVASYDDNADQPAAFGKFFTRSDDPKGRLVVPADGTYDLFVSSRTADTLAGPRYIYRVSITKEEPDFRLAVVNNSDVSGGGWTLRRGGNLELEVVCQRRDGFTGAVTLSAEGLPEKATCVPQVIAANQKEASLVFTAADDAADWVGTFKVKGTAKVGDADVVREARAACIVWPTTQPNVPAVSRMSRALCLAVRDSGPFTLGAPVQELTVPPGGTGTVRITVKRRWADCKGPIQLIRLAGPLQPNGQPIAIPNVQLSPAAASADIKFTIPKNTPSGIYNLVFVGTTTLPIAKDAGAKKANAGFSEPAPPIKVMVFTAAAEVSLPRPLLVLKPGAEHKLDVKIKRLGGFQGDLTLQLVLPKTVEGVSATPVVVGAKADTGTLVVKAAPGAKLGVSPDVLVRAVAKVGGQNINADARLKLAVTEDGTYEDVEPRAVSIVAASSDGWRYEAAAKVKGDKWRLLDFNDNGWKKGKAPLGYGEDEIGARKGTTITETGQPVAFRRVFDLPADVANRKGVTYHLKVASDDTAIVYINGEKADEDPEDDHEFKYWNREVEVPAKLLKASKNVIAVLVKNKEGSSDLYMDLELTALVPGGKK